MGTTSTAFATKQTANFVLSVAFEGLPVILTNGSTSLMTTAFASTTDFSGATVYGGLMAIGKTSGKLSPWDPSVQVDSLEFRVADTHGAQVSSAGLLAAKFLKARHAGTTWTTLTQNVDCDDTAWSVASSSVLDAAPADAIVDRECVRYTALPTGTTMTVGTRGKYAIWTTETGGRYATPHRISTETSFQPVVSNNPTTEHYRRGVVLRAHRIQTDGSYDVTAQAMVVFQGRVQSVRYNGDGSLSFHCDSILKDLVEGTLFSDQFTADLARGITFTTSDTVAVLEQFVSGDATNSMKYPTTFGAAGTVYSHSEVRTALQASLDAAASGGSVTYAWSIDGSGTPDQKYTAHVVASGIGATTVAYMRLSLTKKVWKLLGYGGDGDVWIDTSTGSSVELVRKTLWRVGTSQDFYNGAGKAAVVYSVNMVDGAGITLASPRGTWANQSHIPDIGMGIPASAQGFLQVGDMAVFAVQRNSDTSFIFRRDVTEFFARNGFGGGGIDSDDPLYEVREGDAGAPDAVQVRQVWLESDKSKDAILRFLLSTGTASFNSDGSTSGGTAYDANPFGLGIALPFSLVDVDSWKAKLSDRKITFILDKPIRFSDLLESCLAVAGCNAVMKSGKVTLVSPTISGTNLTATHTLTEANKVAPAGGDDLQRIEADYGSDSIINRVELRYSRRMDGSFARSIVVDDSASVAAFGARKTLTIEGWAIGWQEVDQWAEAVAGNVLAFWSRPTLRIKRTFSHQQIGTGLAAGDTVALTDSGLPDPATGTRGVTNLPCTILSFEFDWQTGIGVCELLAFPEINGNAIAAWAPAGRVASSSVAGGKLTTTLEANHYSDSSETTDAASLNGTGFKYRIVEVSPANEAAPTEYQVTLDSRSGNDLTFTTDPVPGALDTTKVWNVVFDDEDYRVAAQSQKTYLAETLSDAYFMGGSAAPIPFGSTAVPYTQRFVRIADNRDDVSPDEAFSVDVFHDTTKNLNVLLSSVTAQSYLNWVADGSAHTVPTQVGTTPKFVLGGWFPLYGWDRPLKFMALLKHSTAGSSATCRITLSTTPPHGDTLTSVDYLGSTTSASVTSTTTTATGKWSGPSTLTIPGSLPVGGAFLPYGLFFAVELFAGAGGETASLYGVHLREAALT